MGKVVELVPHADFAPRDVRSVTVELVAIDAGRMGLRFAVQGAGGLLLPAPAAPERTDELWKTTCFEAFLRRAGEAGYREFNFAPSGRWAAYAFDGYRAGMRTLPLDVAPHITQVERGGVFRLDVDLRLSDVPAGPIELGLSAVLEERSGTKSFWALVHPPGRPDFHADAGFALRLPHAP